MAAVDDDHADLPLSRTMQLATSSLRSITNPQSSRTNIKARDLARDASSDWELARSASRRRRAPPRLSKMQRGARLRFAG